MEVRKAKEQPDRGVMREKCFCKRMCKGPQVAKSLAKSGHSRRARVPRSTVGAKVQYDDNSLEREAGARWHCVLWAALVSSS